MSTKNKTLDDLLKERDRLKKEHGSQSRQYKKANMSVQSLRRNENPTKRSFENRRQYEKRCAAQNKSPKPPRSTRQEQTQSTSRIHLNFDKNKLAYKSSVKAEPSIGEIFGGNIVEPLHFIPTDAEEAKKTIPNYKPKSKVEEGGILEFEPSLATELSNERKDQIIHVVGRGFRHPSDTDDPDFSFVDARVAHKLLYKHQKTTAVISIKYICEVQNDGTKQRMIALAGAILLSYDLTVCKHSNGKKSKLYNKTLKVCNLVQICILPQYNQRGLGVTTMSAVEGILERRSEKFEADLLVLCGCAKKFYDTVPGCEIMPEMFHVPFRMYEGEGEEAKNREIFRYIVIPSLEQKFEKNVVDKYNQDRTIRFSIDFKNDVLKAYYGVSDVDKENNGGASANSGTTNNCKATEAAIVSAVSSPADAAFIEEDPKYNILEDDADGVKISIEIHNYHLENLKFNILNDGKHLSVYGVREDKGNKYKFEINFVMDPKISRDTVDGNYLSDGSKVTITAKSKVVGCSRN